LIQLNGCGVASPTVHVMDRDRNYFIASVVWLAVLTVAALIFFGLSV